MELKIFDKEDIDKLSLIEVFHILSIDVVIGSIAGGILASSLLHVEPGLAFWVILPAAVWILYNLDHLIDGMRLKENAHTMRHFFHYYYFKRIISIILVFLFLMVPLILFFLEKPILLFGVITAFFTGAYFLIVYFFGNKKSIFVQKEFTVALIYTIGIWGGPASLLSYQFNMGQIMLILTFFISVFIAVIIYSIYEEDTDIIDNHTTLVSRFEARPIKYLLYFLFLLLFVLSISQILFAHQIIYTRAAKLMMLMGIILLIVLSYPETLKQKNHYRFLVEFVFWLPALSYWF